LVSSDSEIKENRNERLHAKHQLSYQVEFFHVNIKPKSKNINLFQKVGLKHKTLPIGWQ
jgi:hypothetical protein